jgi:adenine-specific DNA-methyltransferase
MQNKRQLGQYFTTNATLREKVLEFILNEPDTILEPSVGQGDLIQIIHQKYEHIDFDMYEIDPTIKMLEGIPNNIIYGNFMQQSITKKYKTIVGNPPFVRIAKGGNANTAGNANTTGNLYIDFTDKCYNLLDNGGELIFIVPSDFFKLTSASKLLNEMIQNGSFTHIYHPHNEKMFANASIDIIVFRYCKDGDIDKKVLYNDKLLHIINSSGLITFNKNENTSNVLFKDCFDVYVGLVSGKEKVYKNEEFGNIEVLNGEKKLDKYIFIEEFPCDNENLNKYLNFHKDVLIGRKIRKFNEKNWWEWGAPRNITSIRNNLGKDCIYIYNLTRKSNVAFRGKVKYFGGGLIILIPKKTCDIDNIVAYINSDTFKENFVFSGRFKMGHRQISNSYIPSECLQ